MLGCIERRQGERISPENMKNAKLKLNLNALYQNAKYLMDHTDKGVIAVVKNNGYNFGLEKAVKTFYMAGIRAFATTSLKEAVKIRELYSDVTVIMLNPDTDFEVLRKYNISCSIANLQWLKKNAPEMSGIKWHLEWAGFMRRSGCTTEKEFMDALEFADRNGIEIEGIWTHFAWADEFDKNEMYEHEKSNWLSLLDKVLKKYDFKFIHAQNSASFCRDSKLENHTHIRTGIMLYGCPGYEGWDYRGKIHHALELTASVIAVNYLNEGESIGYCSSYTARQNTSLPSSIRPYFNNVAVINMGYGDGLLRKRTKGHDVIINGKRYPLVSMMMSHTVAVVDDDVKPGDPVWFYGDDIPVFEFTYKGVGANSEQISALNFNSLDVEYIEVENL